MRRRLGAGGFARVYLAWDPDLEIEVAIKVPKAQLADDAEALDRFRREATTAARLRHPNVVTVLTVGRLEEPFDGAPLGAPYLVMDYLPESLGARLAATPILAEPEWLRIGEEIARGLAYAHAQGVVHRDIKPDNILFGRHGEAVVTDFGIARAVSERLAPTSRSIVVGTPEYFSPEQARGLPLDGRTDVYALGVTLYRMATGALPFLGDDWYAIMRQHVEEPPPRPRALNPTLSDAAEQVILRCLVKIPEERFQTAAELSTALAAAARPTHVGGDGTLDGATIDMAAVRPVHAPRVPTPTRRRRSIVVGSALVATVATTLFVVWQRSPPPPKLQVTPAAAEPAPTLPDSLRDSATGAAPSNPLPGMPSGFPPPVAVLTRGSMSVSAPPGAMIYVDDRFVGTSTWHSDTLSIGRHDVRATLSTLANCPTASVRQAVNVTRTRPGRAVLRPRPCGSLQLNVSPPGARFVLTNDAGSVSEGALPLAQPLVLPEGAYRLVIERSYCGKYDERVEIPAERTTTERVRLLC